MRGRNNENTRRLENGKRRRVILENKQLKIQEDKTRNDQAEKQARRGKD